MWAYEEEDPIVAMLVGGAEVPKRMMIRSAAVEQRNTGLTYRDLGKSRERYPEWVHELKGRSGVYVIREWDDDEPRVVYVGESHTGRLYETMTRHFSKWRRWDPFWRGQYSQGHDPGVTYRRDHVEVAVRFTSPEDAIDEEARLIERLRPRDNLRGQDDDDDVPF